MKFLGEENATVAHVTVMREEAVVEPVAGPAEPEVAKKGKTETPDAAARRRRRPARRSRKAGNRVQGNRD